MLLGLFRLSLDHDLGIRLRFPFPRGSCCLNRSDASDSSLKLFNDPGIEAFAGNACRQIDLAMKLRRNARHELTREGLVRLFPALLAECEIIVNRSLEGGFQFGDALSLKGNHVPRVEDFAVENPRFVALTDQG